MPSSLSQAETVWCPRVTVACVVARGDRFLIVEEEIFGELAYNQPAGHLDPGETIPSAAVRETLEETGHTIALDAFLGVWQWTSHEHGEQVLRFSFAGHVVSHDPDRVLDEGIRRALWLRRDEIEAMGPRLRSPLIMRTIDAWLDGRRLPLDTVESLLPGLTP
ncbi:NUDIX hydrolase [Luteibacter rhizovicinus DSM 16549]|uniref:Phosphatase NudJ n=1 Tax=Luteibacter rhizovicinus DSM 16549 TaxID=1440763 RepID=A0A0G9HH33_9GAMM|nr:NUDIX hydrolase [Luteibacter rhizovicinus]APG04903.1 NUDIX hydrolase [Luteibacter rhizovicinus DSM 16549]KLD68494.1 7,8-dihydro-8-oxoguanine-triphosphatase [Luteibacter rhizovicinus DSM 16549]KLD76722.1 7,8-dihydro-8-oxoguanine-triphosphatase [Xanthomonas hyacinthi DSM 19077]